MSDKGTATITMSASVLGQIREFARTQKRTLSQQLEMLVEERLRKPARSRGKKKGTPVE